MRWIESLCLAGLLHALPAAAQEALPSPTTLRYDEDWRALAAPGVASTDPLDASKYTPLTDDGSVYVVIGAEVRARYEGYANNFTSDAAPLDDGYLWLRALPYADLHAGRTRFFVQPMAAYALGVKPEPGPVDRTGLDLLQGFAEAALGDDGRFVLRAGRQLVSLGSERLVGTRYGPNVPRAFDGVRLDASGGNTKLALVWARPVAPGPRDFDDRSNSARSLWAAYATLKAGPGKADIYYIGTRNTAAVWDTATGGEARHTFGLRSFGKSDNWRWNIEAMAQVGIGTRNTAAVWDTATGGEARHTFGLRSFGKSDNWRWNIEAMAQVGRVGPQRIRAWSLASELTRAWPDASLAPSVDLKANIASGDKDRGDRTLGTFDALYPKGQYFGELTPIGPYNMINVHLGASVQPLPELTLGIAASDYWRHRRADGVYAVPGGLLRSGDLGTARHVGSQLELTLDWQATRHVALSASLSSFRPGQFLSETGFTETIGMAALEVAHKF